METTVRHEEGPIKGYLATFKFYDSKHRRLSIFGRVVDGKLEVTVLTLSETPEVKTKLVEQKNAARKPKRNLYIEEFVYDTFSRKEGRNKYETACLGGDGKCPGRVEVVDIIEDRPRYTFLRWCNERFYREQKEVVTVTKVSYIRGTKFVHPDKKKRVVEIPLGIANVVEVANEDKSTETA